MSSAEESKGSLEHVTILLDRDGTLNRDPGYIGRPEDFELLPGVAAALARLNDAGALLIVVTNQSGIARGKFTVADLERIHEKLQHRLAIDGARVDAIYFCPHHPADGCACRKPAVGMVKVAMADFRLDGSCMYVVGDQFSDIEMAKRLNARSVLMMTGNDGNDTLTRLRKRGMHPEYIADRLDTAVDWIFTDAIRPDS